MIFTDQQLVNIEREVDQILERAKQLDPHNAADAEILYFDDCALEDHLRRLKASHTKARIKESGLFIVPSL